MTPTTSEVIHELTLAEASAWLTRLQESGRTAAVEAAFKDWLSASPAHARAFTRLNDVWELLPGAVELAGQYQPQTSPPRRVRARRTPWLVAAACAVLAIVALGVVRMLRPGTQIYETAVGAQQTIELNDHTRVTLNTDTRIVVEYRKYERHVALQRGEALFHVAKDPQRPFVVQTGNEQIVDLGTVFDVRHYAQSIAVTLLRGKVWVGARAAAGGHPAPSTVLVPGDRLTIQVNGARALDRPDLDQALAWQSGQVYFDGTTLAAAAAELNLYGGPLIRIDDPALAALRVSGVFSVHDPMEFATAVASLHDLHAERNRGAIELERR